MSLEELTKSQLILLTVLVNFVVSIATGILTISLLDQVPPVVSQTVNHIVERTVEKVAQAAPATVIQAPQPSVEDLITAAFTADEQRKITLYAADTGTSTSPLAIGVYLPKARVVATITTESLPKEILVTFPNDFSAHASLTHTDGAITLYGFAEGATLPPAPPIALLSSKSLKLGQTALALTADGGAATGIISKVSENTVYTTLPVTGLGTAAVDLQGNLIGISNGVAGAFVSTDRILALLSATSTPVAATH